LITYLSAVAENCLCIPCPIKQKQNFRISCWLDVSLVCVCV